MRPYAIGIPVFLAITAGWWLAGFDFNERGPVMALWATVSVGLGFAAFLFSIIQEEESR